LILNAKISEYIYVERGTSTMSWMMTMTKYSNMYRWMAYIQYFI